MTLSGQVKTDYVLKTIAFYNVENLFDTINQPDIEDDARTPLGKDHWTTQRYQKKLADLATILSAIGTPYSNNSPDIIGLCEVENDSVLQELVNQKPLQNKGYESIHFDSPDRRGIDVALLYKTNSFYPTTMTSRRLVLYIGDNERKYTRDQLVVGGLLDDEQYYFIVNHWPSRSGGESRSRRYRMSAANLNKRIIDSLRKENPIAKIISMGDFNDDPTNASFKKVLQTKGSKNQLEETSLYNPMEKLYRSGEGSLAYRDRWNLFDQFYMTASVTVNNGGYHYWKSGIFTIPELITQNGRYKGYPLRTYAGGAYVGGYSDHFPVYLFLIKEKK